MTKIIAKKNACKRFLENFRRELPHLKAIIVEDGLSSTVPNIRMIEEHGSQYILVTKTGDHQFHCVNSISLNKSNMIVKVDLIEYR